MADKVMNSAEAWDALEAMIVYTGEVLYSMRGADVLAFTHGMENDYTEANRLFKELPEEIRERLMAAQLRDND